MTGMLFLEGDGASSSVLGPVQDEREDNCGCAEDSSCDKDWGLETCHSGSSSHTRIRVLTAHVENRLRPSRAGNPAL